MTRMNTCFALTVLSLALLNAGCGTTRQPAAIRDTHSSSQPMPASFNGEMVALRGMVLELSSTAEETKNQMSALQQSLRESEGRLTRMEMAIQSQAGELDLLRQELLEQKPSLLMLTAAAYSANPRRGPIAEFLAGQPFDDLKTLKRDLGLTCFLELCLLRFAYGEVTREVAQEVYGYSFDDVVSTAKNSLWRVSLPEKYRSSLPRAEICESISATRARSVLVVTGTSKGGIEYLSVIPERLYCFAGKSAYYNDRIVAFVLNRGRVICKRVGSSVKAQNWNSRDYAAVPEAMNLPILGVSKKNQHHWNQNAFGTPVWAKTYIAPDFAKVFKPDAPNMKGEQAPTLIAPPRTQNTNADEDTNDVE